MRTRRSVTDLAVHVVWSTKRRQPFIPESADANLQRFLALQADAMGCKMLAVGNASDHVHVLVRLDPTVALAALVQQLKGATAHAWNHSPERPNSLEWQDGYWAVSCNPLQLDAVVNYLAQQRVHHAQAALVDVMEPPPPPTAAKARPAKR